MTLNENDKNSVLKLTIRLNEIRKHIPAFHGYASDSRELDTEQSDPPPCGRISDPKCR